MKAKSDNKKIVLGFSGSLDSVVCAYLLKKQGFEVIAIGIQFHTAGQEHLPPKLDENGQPKTRSEFQGVYLIDDLDRVKKLADALDITFYAAEASAAYQDRVTDGVVAARIGGELFSPKVHATQLIFDVLIQKADVLQASFVATGHYAKVVRNKLAETINIFVSNDLEGDQSYLLCTLAREVMERMYLPLSDMRISEVRKIAEGLKLGFSDKEPKIPLMQRPELGEFVGDRAAKKLFKEGTIIDYKNEAMMGDHGGIHEYGLGLNSIKVKSGTSIDKDLMVIGFKYTPGIIFVGLKEDLGYDICILKNIKYAPGMDLSCPQEVFVKSTECGEKLAATFYPYNNGYAEISFKQKQEGLLFRGDHLAIYNRAGAMGKVLASGEVFTSGFMENGQLRTMPLKKDEREDEPMEINDIYRFKF
jgi:tRNA-specific 2-thiouridylase